MCLIFTCGEHTFRKNVEDYNGIVCQCHNCGNYSGTVVKTNPWFTFCFIPVIPLSMKGYVDVVCSICNFAQPIQQRQDIQAMAQGGKDGAGGGGGVPLQQRPPGQGPPQGWNTQPPQQGQQPMRYS